MENSESGADSSEQDDIYPAFGYQIYDFEHFYDPYVSKTHRYKFFLPSKLLHTQTIVQGYNHPVQPYRPLCDDPSDPLFYLNIPLGYGAETFLSAAAPEEHSFFDAFSTDEWSQAKVYEPSDERALQLTAYQQNVLKALTNSALQGMTVKAAGKLRRFSNLSQPAPKVSLVELPYPSVVIRPIAPQLTQGLTPSGQHCKHRAIEQATFYQQYEEDFGVVCLLLAKLLSATLSKAESALRDIKQAVANVQRGVPFTLTYINIDAELIPLACSTVSDVQAFLRKNVVCLGDYEHYNRRTNHAPMYPPTTAERIIDADEIENVSNTASTIDGRMTQFTDFRAPHEHAIYVQTKAGLLFVPAESKRCTTTYRLVQSLIAVCDSSYFTTGPLAAILPALRVSFEGCCADDSCAGAPRDSKACDSQTRAQADDSGENPSRPGAEKARRTNREKYEQRGFEDESGVCKVCNKQYSSYFRHSAGENHLANYAATFDTPLRKKASNLLQSTYETCRQYVERHMAHLNKRSYLNAQMHVIASQMAARHLIYYETACRLLTFALFYFDVQFVVSEVESVVRSDSPTARSPEFVDFVRQQRERRAAADEAAANACFAIPAGASSGAACGLFDLSEPREDKADASGDQAAAYASKSVYARQIACYQASGLYEVPGRAAELPGVNSQRYVLDSAQLAAFLANAALADEPCDAAGDEGDAQCTRPAYSVYLALAEQLSLVRPIRRGLDVYAALTAKYVTLTPEFYASCLYSRRAQHLHVHFVNYVESILGHAVGREMSVLNSEQLVAALQLFDLDTVHPCVAALASMVKNALLCTGSVTFESDGGAPLPLLKAQFYGFEELGDFNIRGPEQTVGIPLLQAVYCSVFEQQALADTECVAEGAYNGCDRAGDILQACERVSNGFQLVPYQSETFESEITQNQPDFDSDVLTKADSDDAEHSAPCGDEQEMSCLVRSNSVGWRDYSYSKDQVSFVKLWRDQNAHPTSNFVRSLVDMAPEYLLLDCAKDCLLSLQDNYGLGLHDAILVELRALQLLAEAYQGVIDGTGVAVVPYERYTLRMMCGVQ